jgi:hypothetical protein
VHDHDICIAVMLGSRISTSRNVSSRN